MGVPRGTCILSLPRLYAVSWFGTGWFELCLTRTREPKPSVCVRRIDIISDSIVIALPDTTGSGCRELSLSCVESSPFGLPSLTQQHLRKRLCIHSSIQQEYTGMSMRSLFWCFATESITDNPALLTTKRTAGQQER